MKKSMKNLLKSLFSTSTSPISINYDTFNREAAEITNHNKKTGLSLELSSVIFPFLQFTAIKTNNITQYFTTFSKPNSVFQFCFDSDRSIQLKASALAGPFITKWHTILTSKKQAYTQIESIYNSTFYNLGFKIISPSFNISNLIYIINYCQSYKNINLGVEAVGINNEVGISFISRIVKSNSIYSLNIQRFNMIIFSFYRRISKLLEIGVELRKAREYFGTAAGLRMRNYKSEVKLCVDNKLNIGFDWEEKLSERFMFNFNTTYDGDGFEYGIGFIYS